MNKIKAPLTNQNINSHCVEVRKRQRLVIVISSPLTNFIV